MLANLFSTVTDSSTQARQAALRTQILLLGLVVALGLFLFDLFHIRGLMPGGIPFYALLFGGIGLALFLNRDGHYTASSCVALLTLNAVLFAFSLAANALLPLFILIGVVALVIIPFDYAVVRSGFVLLSYVLFCISLFADFEIFPSDADAAAESVLLFVSITTAIGCLTVVLQFYINLSRATEASLQQRRRHLLQLTDDLQKSQDRFQLVIKGSRAGIYEWSVKTNTLYLSDEWKHILGYTSDELNDFKIDDLSSLMHPDDLPDLLRKIKEHFDEKRPFQNESRRRHKNGTYRWIYDSGLSKLDDSGNIDVVVGSIIDITERKGAELVMLDQNEWLKKSNQELDRLVNNASHDLRSPLSSVLGLLAISEHAGSKEEIFAYHGMIRERVKKLDNFVTEVLAYSRNSNHEVVMAPVSLAQLVSEIVDELKYADAKVVIDISPVVAADLTIVTDHTRLKTVIGNLIGNSIKYCDPRKDQPFIKVEAQVDNKGCTLAVHDNGIGIASEYQEKVFEMFFRATENSSGSGLGLFITKEIVEKLGGAIEMRSTPRVGTSVFVKLPTAYPVVSTVLS
jgi:PAS domain S-box-containing protein